MPKALPKDINSQSSNNKNTDDKYEKLVTFAQKEIKWVGCAYKLAASIIGAIMVVGIYFTFDNLSDLRSEIQYIKTEIEKKVEKEFDDDKIKKLIQDVAVNRVQVVADTVIVDKIEEKIQPHIKSLNDSVRTLQKNISKMEDKLARINPKLSQITQKLITFSFIIGNKPELWEGGMTTEYKQELEDLTISLGQLLMFNADSLLKEIEKREKELNN
ncbi:hypothetical protein ACFL5D_02785 [Candidatus Neomarinimicrobiota bacterium]